MVPVISSLQTAARFLLLLPALVTCLVTVQAQDCAFTPCANDDCGSLNVKFSPKGGPIFCEGETIIFENSSDTGFTYFLVDWKDGVIDTLYNNASFSHIYNLPDSVRCEDGDVVYLSVCFKGVRECAAGITCQSGSYSFGIRKKPKARFGSGDVCLGESFGFFNLSCHALTAQWEFGDGNGSWDLEPTHTYDSLGNYVVRLIVSNTCGTDTSYGGVSVVLNPEAGFNRQKGFKAWCDSLPVTERFFNASNQYTTFTRWTILPADSTKWQFTDTLMSPFSKNIEVAFLDTGTYVIQLRAWNACGSDTRTDTIRILLPPDIYLYPPTPTCDSVVVTPISLGLSYEGPIDSLVWIFDYPGGPDTLNGFAFPPIVYDSSGTVRLRLYGPCGIIERQVEVVVPLSPVITFSGFPAFYCQNSPPIALPAQPPGGRWQGLGAAGGSISPDGWLDPSGLEPGQYVFQYALDSLQCPVDATISLEIRGEPAFLLNPTPAACGSKLYVPEVSYQGHITTYQWLFPGGTPPVSNQAFPPQVLYAQPGSFPVYLTASGSCGTYTDSIVVVVQPPLNLKINAPPPPICTHTLPFALTANRPGGIWFGPGILDPFSGLFDPAIVPPGQPITIAYALSEGVCTDTAYQIVVVNVPEPVTVPDRFFCINNPPAILQAAPPGGTWAGPGIVQPAFGLFNPAQAGAGVWTVTYTRTDSNGCIARDSAQMTVEVVPEIFLLDTAQVCLVPGIIDLEVEFAFSALPPGGTVAWTGPGVNPVTGQFNPLQVGLTPGTYKYDVTYSRNGCQVTATAVIVLSPAAPLVLPPDTLLCVADSPLALSAQPPGGTWSGPGIHPQTGIIDLYAAGSGPQTYLYTVAPGTSCNREGIVVVDIVDPAAVVVTGPDLQPCAGTEWLTLEGFSPAGGFWTGPALVDSLLGILDLSQLPPGQTYLYQYCLETDTPVACTSCRSREITVLPRPDIQFEFDTYPCLDLPFQVINQSGNATAYLWNFGDGTTSTEAEPQHQYQQEGAYTIQLIATSAQGCPDTFELELFVTLPPVADFELLVTEGCAPFPVEVVNQSYGHDITQLWLIQGDSIFGPSPGGFLIDQITSDSVFTVTLQVSNNCGTRIVEKEVLVRPYPVVDFGFNVAEGCTPLLIEFANITLGNPQTFLWDLGNGQFIADTLPPPQVYTTTDSTVTIYPVTLISTNACGADTLTREITVYPPDVQAFIQLPSLEGCQPMWLQPGNYSTPGAVSQWQVFDPQGNLIHASNQFQPSFLLEQPGIYTLILYASRCGVDTDTVQVLVRPAPEVSFTHLPSVCLGAPIQFANTSQQAAGQLWDFGDGQQSTLWSPQHTYTQPGIYVVTLTAFSLFNDCPATYQSLVEVRESPGSSFSASVTQGCAPLTVQFAHQPDGTGELQYIWTFGDGSSAQFLADPQHTFTLPGQYLVSLLTYDAAGCFSDTAQWVIQVYPSPQAQVVLPPGPLCSGADTIWLESGDSSALGYAWLIDGQMFNTARVPWLPSGPGTASIQLIVVNAFQCRDSVTLIREVLPAPEAVLAADLTVGCEDLEVQFSNFSAFAGTYFWEFGDGGSAFNEAPRYRFTEPGNWTVRLVAYSAEGCPPDTAALTILVHPRPEAEFQVQQSGDCGAPQVITITDQSVKAETWNWDFGDGGSSLQRHPQYTYMTPGEWTIRLVAANVHGCLDTLSRQVHILGQPVADFDLEDLAGCSPMRVRPLNLSSQALSYTWEIAGLGSFTGAEPEWLFTEPGSYSIRLIARYTEACTDTLEWPAAIRIYRGPEAGFEMDINGDENRIGEVVFTNTTLYGDRFWWDLGDGQTATSRDVFHEYDRNGTICVTLVAYQDNGGLFTCVDTVRQCLEPEWITTFFAPNAMTPGYGSSEIQVFRPVGIGIATYEIAVYAPWGELLWTSTELEQNQPVGFWDGTFRGEQVPQGAYAWVARMRFVNGVSRVVNGTVTVLR